MLPIAGRAKTRNEGIKIALCASGELAEQPDVDLCGGPIIGSLPCNQSSHSTLKLLPPSPHCVSLRRPSTSARGARSIRTPRKPFVGPAGRVLDRALAEAAIPREEVFVTNAVKHFKHEMRGKRRLHKRPNSYEIERCKVWLELERAIVKPAVVVALGGTAARSLLARAVTITKLRRHTLQLPDGTAAFVTIHPSLLLRIEDHADKEQEYRAFVADLKLAANVLAQAA